MNACPPNDELLSRYLDGLANDAELAALQERFIDCPEAVDALVAMVRLEVLIRAQLKRADCTHSLETSLPLGDNRNRGIDGEESGEEVNDSGIAGPTPVTRPCPSTFGFPSTALYDAVGSLSSGWPVAYLIATVILGIGLVIGAVTHVSQPVQVVLHSPTIHSVVGRITGMANCEFAEGSGARVQGSGLPSPASGRWAGGEGGPSPQSPVSLGDRFSLASGLMEITYDTGAKVVLQGPVTYEVESKNGGFMSIGRLTGKVATASAKGFVVRTPTATVTDLGTEFGVEVAKDGGFEVHVLTGLVETRFAAAAGRASQLVRLKAGEACRYRPQLGVAAVIPADRAKFEQMRIVKADDRRQRWLTYSRQLRSDPSLLAYYSFESVGKDSWLLPNAAPTGNALDAEVQGPLWTTGRFAGKVALRFRGPGTGDKVVLPEQERFNFTGPFSIAVWFKVAHFPSYHAGLVTKGNHSWRLQQSSDRKELLFAANYGPEEIRRVEGRTQVDDNQWHLAVVVYEPRGTGAHIRLFLDGMLDAEHDTTQPLYFTDHPVWLGANSRQPDLEFPGLIDEVAILTRALSAEEVRAMFDAGNPAGPLRGESDKNK